MAICPNCLNEKSDDHLFCPRCGYRSESALAEADASKTTVESEPLEPAKPSLQPTAIEDEEQFTAGQTRLEDDDNAKEKRTMLYEDSSGVDDEAKEAEEPMLFAWVVLLDEENLPIQQIRLLKSKNILGNGKETDITLDDDFVSRLHAMVYYESSDGEYYLSDLGSTNGTFLNKRKIMKEKLTDGDCFRIGDTHMIFKRVNRELEMSPQAGQMGEKK